MTKSQIPNAKEAPNPGLGTWSHADGQGFCADYCRISSRNDREEELLSALGIGIVYGRFLEVFKNENSDAVQERTDTEDNPPAAATSGIKAEANNIEREGDGFCRLDALGGHR
jgi:hypothetical protein